MAWDEALAGLCAGLSLPEGAAAAAREGKGMRLVFDGALAVDFLLRDDGLWLKAGIGPIPEFAERETLAAMLAANRPGLLSGAWLCLEEDGAGASLARHFDAPPEGDGLRLALELFLGHLKEWKSRIG